MASALDSGSNSIVLAGALRCVFPQETTLIVSPFTLVYKWALVTLRWTSIPSWEEVEVFLAA